MLSEIILFLYPFLLFSSIYFSVSAKSFLIALGLTASASATDTAIQAKYFDYGLTTLKISNKEIIDNMEIFKSIKEHGSLIKGVSKTIENEVKE